MTFTMEASLWMASLALAVVIIGGALAGKRVRRSRRNELFAWLAAITALLLLVVIAQLVATEAACGSILGCDPPPIEDINGQSAYLMWLFVGGLPTIMASLATPVLFFRLTIGLWDGGETQLQEEGHE
jgi:hypothetical protein